MKRKIVEQPTRINPAPQQRPRFMMNDPSHESCYDNSSAFDGDNSLNSVVICFPKRLEEVQSLIDSIKKKQPLIMDLTGLSDEVACRILDFMSGAVYAVSGSMQNYKGSFYLITPEGCSIKKISK